MSVRRRQNLEFSQKELIDLGIAWVALAVAFAIFFAHSATLTIADLTVLVGISAVTVGVGFLLHELAHKVVAVRFNQIAEFRADYKMLFVAVMSALLGFIVAAPGAVHHRGRLTEREHGLIAVAGPVTNLALVALFFPLLALDGILGQIGGFGVLINSFLAAFNMIPFGPLDGKTVIGWNKLVFAAVLLAGVGLTVWSFITIGYPL